MKKLIPLFLVTFAAISFAFIAPKKTDPKIITVIIDAAHGGNDHGAAYNDFTEKDIVEQITQKIKSQNLNKNVVLHFTRTSDKFTSLEDRFKFINAINADLVISLHVNANKNTTSSGSEIYVYREGKKFDASLKIAENLIQKFSKNTSIKASNIKDGRFLILRKSEAPSILVELGYLTNDYDRKYLTDDTEQNAIAATILELIKELK